MYVSLSLSVRFILTRGANACPAVRIFAALYAALVTDALNKYSYYAQLANLSFSLENDQDSLVLCVYGFNQKARVLLERILDTMKNLTVRACLFLRAHSVRGA